MVSPSSRHPTSSRGRLLAVTVAVGFVAVVLIRSVGAMAAGTRQAAAAPATVPTVDLQRYAGTWYEVARLPNKFQRQCVGDVTAQYTPRPDGRIEVLNRCRTADGMTVARGVARRRSGDSSNARLEVRFAPAWLSFLPVVWGDYWIIDLADDYSTAVVGSPDREYLWLLSRTPALDAHTYGRLVETAASQGFPVSRLERTVQS